MIIALPTFPCNQFLPILLLKLASKGSRNIKQRVMHPNALRDEAKQYFHTS